MTSTVYLHMRSGDCERMSLDAAKVYMAGRMFSWSDVVFVEFDNWG